MKGVLNVKGEDRRQVFHGVHMMFDAQAGAALGHGAAHEQPGVHRPRPGPRRARSRLRIRRREVIVHGGQTIAVFRARAAAPRRSTTTSPTAPGRPTAAQLAVAGGEGKVGAGTRHRGDSALRRHRRALVRHAGGRLAAARATLRDLRPGRRDRAVGCGDRHAAQALEARGGATQALAYSPGGEMLATRRGQGGDAVVAERREGACLCAGGEHRGGAGLRQARHRYRGCPEW